MAIEEPENRKRQKRGGQRHVSTSARRKGRIARRILFAQNDVHRMRRGNVLGALESERREVNA